MDNQRSPRTIPGRRCAVCFTSSRIQSLTALKRKDVSRAMRKVANWQLARASDGFNRDWTFAALYAGFMAVPEAANGKKYQDALLLVGKKLTGSPARVSHMRTIWQSAKPIWTCIPATAIPP